MSTQNKNKDHASSTRIRMLVYFVAFVFATSTFADVKKEYEVKAAFIVKMVSFITWPESTSAQTKDISSERLTICIADSKQASRKFRDLLLANGVLEKHFKVAPLNDLEECNVLFVSKMPKREYLHLLSNIESLGPILTFSDSPGYARQGVMVNFYTEQQKIRFEINWNKMKSKGFAISSRILKLARIIDGD